MPVNGQHEALAAFRQAADDVPAYQAFLKENGIDPSAVTEMDGFRSLPLTTKTNYFHKYPLPMLCHGGTLQGCDFLCVSSGSTGEPTGWPRRAGDEAMSVARFDLIFREAFQADQKPTLAVVCFPMGLWVGGMYTASCVRQLAAKGYPVTLVTPGNNAAEILRAVRTFAPCFEQTVLLGYPPFIKGVVDTASAQGIALSRFNLKMVFAGEVFTEEWRALVCRRAGIADPVRNTASLYGTADGGVLAAETPLSIAIRRFLAQRPERARAVFGESRLPTLAQYDPRHRFFEVTEEGTLLFTCDSATPLIRYHIADSGGLFPYAELLDRMTAAGFVQSAVDGSGAQGLPFVYVFGRSHFAISLYGANVYPENVSVGLEQDDIAPWVTGKFVMETPDDADGDRILAIAVELAPGVAVSPEREALTAESIKTHLLRLNSEYANYLPPDRQVPQITLHPFGDPEYFPVGVKHRYTRG